MALQREQKGHLIEALKEAISASPSVVFVNFKGISVGDTSAMRRALREKHISYKVAKKTLLRRALRDVKISGEVPELPGELAVAYSTGAEAKDDATKSAREMYSFVKRFKGGLSIMGGVFGGRYLGGLEMNEIASIPSLETLRGMFVNVINAPLQGLVIALNEIAKQKV